MGWHDGVDTRIAGVARCSSAVLILCLTGSLGGCRRPVAEKQRRERGAIEALREEADALRQDIQQQDSRARPGRAR
ncbi:MAG: hypothetical protein MZV70_02910 [Desulfobacterales bacterium]|nr:hypothetical protein [Desulfobacterales bacterium]